MTCVWLPRSMKWMSASPATSSAKRVQRSHRMQRSRSRWTRSLIGIGFSKCRFSSMNRDSPGPCEYAWSCSGHSPPLSQTGQSSGWLARRNSRTPSWAFFVTSQRRAATGVDLDDAHAAHADRVHPRVVAEARDVGAVALGGVDDQFVGAGVDLDPVDGDLHGRLGGCVRHRRTPLRLGGLRAGCRRHR